MGDKWEAVVKSIKFYLRRTIGDTLLSFEASVTLLTQIEGLLNSRPLEPLSEDPEDVNALTSGHFSSARHSIQCLNKFTEPQRSTTVQMATHSMDGSTILASVVNTIPSSTTINI